MKKIKTIICISGLILLLVGCGSYKGELIAVNNTSKIYHRDNCKLISNEQYQNLFIFDDLEETACRGYRPCKTCSPPTNIKFIKELYELQVKEFDELKLKFEKHKKYIDESPNTYEIVNDRIILPNQYSRVKGYNISTKFMTVEECQRYFYLLDSIENLKSYIEK